MDARTDADLLSAVLEGDERAYAVLWERHFPAARRYAHRLFAARADDLVSESFLAIYQQVTTTDAGPRFAFRSYLKTVLRNTAMRWSNEARQMVLAEMVDSVDERDALSMAEVDSEAGDVLAALQALPERWQRVLWLAEVAEVGRPAIARELGVKANAVSALQRRARAGLKYQWLILQVPPAVRDDQTHAARLFPQYLTEPANAAVSAEVNLHIAECTPCRALLRDTRSSAARMGGSTLAVLLGTGGVGAATAALSSATTAIAAVAGAGAMSWLVGGGIAAVTAGSLVISSFFTVGPAVAEPQPERVQTVPSAATPPASSAEPTASAASPAVGAPERVSGQPDPADQALGLTDDPAHYFPGYQSRPDPASNVPDPGIGPTPEPSPTTGPGSSPTGFTPGVTSPTSSSAYISPIIAGKTSPGTKVAVQIDTRRFTPEVASDGSWSLDTRGLELTAGSYTYQARAYTDFVSSAAVDGAFTVLPLEIRGFENITGFEDLTTTQAATTGLIVEFQGPVNGVVYVQTMEGITALVALDADGYAKRRLLVHSYGWYWFNMRYLDSDGYMGPGWEHNLDVYDPVAPYDPMGPNPEDMTYEFVTP
ncbi:sigma-70 family RNA polymerase sigma factor [Microbacterium azadirachtae]|uniref:sigma-70 family RNA polymerase sigma factor n=1 Tax=Microbacterium azadirachtae TaxID=582680 RepID=UPI001364D457|nr:sigma-70 family RNA polymerase sigma factor [Microbacterium azadirachtae]